MPLQEAIDRYHALLSDSLAEETQAQLDAQLRRRGLFFGDRPLCTVLRPRFLTPDQYRFLRRRVGVMLGALGTAYRAAVEDAEFRGQFRLLEWEEELVQMDPGFREASPVSRLDAFFVHERGGLRFTEYNAETPAGAAYGDLLSDVFLGLPVMREFLRHHEVRPLPARHNVLHALVDAYHQFSGRRETPRICILDWREVPTYSEFLVTVDYFRSQGVACEIADPREVEYRDGRLYAGDFAVDLIYKRVLISELVERGGMDHPVMRAVRDGAVCMVNPFRCKILHKKASLAVLSDERNAALFSADEREAIDAHVPWTRVVEERRTVFDGEEVDLLEFSAAHREHLVLKPNDEYGGAGIVLGWETDQEAWEEALQSALAEPYVVQDRVALPTEVYPSMGGAGGVEFADRIVDTAPFVFRGAFMDGCLTRLSTESLVNVTAGGGSSLATFLVQPR
jgi:uncharacterized circularly permuted ATP-grasp superfamily protein